MQYYYYLTVFQSIASYDTKCNFGIDEMSFVVGFVAKCNSKRMQGYHCCNFLRQKNSKSHYYKTEFLVLPIDYLNNSYRSIRQYNL